MTSIQKTLTSKDLFAKPGKLGSVPMMSFALLSKAPEVGSMPMYGRRLVRQEGRGEYQLALTILPCGHLLTFDCPGATLSEIVVPSDVPGGAHLMHGSIASFPCPNEKDFAHRLTIGGAGGTHQVHYMCSIQTEVLPEGLYSGALREIFEDGRSSNALMRAWSEGSSVAEGQCLSMLDVQRFAHEVHIQSYHFMSATGFVLRIQSLFEIVRARVAAR
jgi:hypothetical protein